MGTNTPNPSRRSLLAALPAAALAAPAAAHLAPPAPHPDAQLLAACARVTANERRFIALHDEIEDDDERAPFVDAVMEQGFADLAFVVATGATTIEGLRAKLTAALIEDQELYLEATEAAEKGPAEAGNNVALQGSLLRDLVAVLRPPVTFDSTGRPK